MSLSTRERYMAVAVSAAIGVWAFDRAALSPYLARRDELARKQGDVATQLSKARKVIADRDAMRQEWDRLGAAGPRADPSEAERLMMHAIQQWAQECGVGGLSLKSERANEPHGFIRVTVHATGTGAMPAVAALLWRVESATTMPVRVGDLQVSPVKEGAGDLQLQWDVSTLAASPEAEKDRDKDKGAAPKVAAAAR
jgi:hypothetical protein